MTKYSERFYADDLAYGFVINTSTKEIVKLFSREYGQALELGALMAITLAFSPVII